MSRWADESSSSEDEGTSIPLPSYTQPQPVISEPNRVPEPTAVRQASRQASRPAGRANEPQGHHQPPSSNRHNSGNNAVPTRDLPNRDPDRDRSSNSSNNSSNNSRQEPSNRRQPQPRAAPPARGGGDWKAEAKKALNDRLAGAEAAPKGKR